MTPDTFNTTIGLVVSQRLRKNVGRLRANLCEYLSLNVMCLSGGSEEKVYLEPDVFWTLNLLCLVALLRDEDHPNGKR